MARTSFAHEECRAADLLPASRRPTSQEVHVTSVSGLVADVDFTVVRSLDGRAGATKGILHQSRSFDGSATAMAWNSCLSSIWSLGWAIAYGHDGVFANFQVSAYFVY